MPREPRIVRAVPEVEGNLLDAAAMGNIPLTKILMEKGFSIAEGDEFGVLPLHRACTAGKIEVVRFLLEEGANVDALTHGNLTPLMCASNNGHIDILNVLLEKGADVLIQSEEGHTAADIAHIRNHNNVAAVLDRQMIQYATATDIFDAASKPDMVYLKYSILNKKISPNVKDNEGVPLAIRAMRAGRLPALTFLLGCSEFDANAYDSEGYTLIHHALKDRVSLEVLDAIINCEKVDPAVRTKTDHGYSSLMLAVAMSNYEGITALMQRYLDLDVYGLDGQGVRVDGLCQELDDGGAMLKFLKSQFPAGFLKFPKAKPAEEEEMVEEEED